MTRGRSNAAHKADATGLRAGLLLIGSGLLALMIFNSKGPEVPAATATATKAEVGKEEVTGAKAGQSSKSKLAVTHSVTAARHPPEDQDAESAWQQRFQTFPEPPLADDAMVGDYSIAEHRQFKEEYYCDLAIQAREQCERLPDEQAYQQCLSLRSYYTYGRQCEYLP